MQDAIQGKQKRTNSKKSSGPNIKSDMLKIAKARWMWKILIRLKFFWYFYVFSILSSFFITVTITLIDKTREEYWVNTCIKKEGVLMFLIDIYFKKSIEFAFIKIQIFLLEFNYFRSLFISKKYFLFINRFNI